MIGSIVEHGNRNGIQLSNKDKKTTGRPRSLLPLSRHLLRQRVEGIRLTLSQLGTYRPLVSVAPLRVAVRLMSLVRALGVEIKGEILSDGCDAIKKLATMQAEIEILFAGFGTPLLHTALYSSSLITAVTIRESIGGVISFRK